MEKTEIRGKARLLVCWPNLDREREFWRPRGGPFREGVRFEGRRQRGGGMTVAGDFFEHTIRLEE